MPAGEQRTNHVNVWTVVCLVDTDPAQNLCLLGNKLWVSRCLICSSKECKTRDAKCSMRTHSTGDPSNPSMQVSHAHLSCHKEQNRPALLVRASSLNAGGECVDDCVFSPLTIHLFSDGNTHTHVGNICLRWNEKANCARAPHSQFSTTEDDADECRVCMATKQNLSFAPQCFFNILPLHTGKGRESVQAGKPRFKKSAKQTCTGDFHNLTSIGRKEINHENGLESHTRIQRFLQKQDWVRRMHHWFWKETPHEHKFSQMPWESLINLHCAPRRNKILSVLRAWTTCTYSVHMRLQLFWKKRVSPTRRTVLVTQIEFSDRCMEITWGTLSPFKARKLCLFSTSWICEQNCWANVARNPSRNMYSFKCEQLFTTWWEEKE